MVKKYNDFDPQLESAVLTDKAKLSLYKKSVKSGIPANILEEVYNRGYNTWNPSFGYSPEQFAFDRVNSFISGGFAVQLDEDLRNWFNPKHPEGGWKRINSKGEVAGPCAREEGEPKPKCMSNEKIAQLSKKERAVAVAAKRRHDPVADRSGKGGKPINVSNYGKGKISEEFLEEKNKPTNPELWSKAKSLARSKFDVYPSAYANGWAAKWYKSKGGGWKSVSEETIDEKCWDGYKQVGMKKKGERMVPNCVPVKEEDLDEGKLKDSLKVAALVGALGAHGGKIYDVGNIATHHDDPALAAATIASYAHPASRALQALPTALKVDKAGKGENEFERQKKYPKKKVQESKVTEEPHSKNPKKPSSRFIGSNELTDIYKSETPGQIIKRVVKEQLEEGIRPGTRNYASVKDNPRKYANEYPKGFRQPGVASKEELRKQAAELSKGVKVKRVEEETVSEATYKGKKVPLNKPMKGDVKKSKVFVDPDGDGKAQKVNFGDKSLSIKKHIPARKKSYCARSGGQGNLTDKTSANYWSRRAWNCEETEVNELSGPAGTTGKRKEVSSPLVSIRMASGKIEKHPPGKSGSSGGGDE